MRATAKLENVSKNVKIASQIDGIKYVFHHKFAISKPSERIEMDALINHEQPHLCKLLEHQSVQLFLRYRSHGGKIIEGHSAVLYELF